MMDNTQIIDSIVNAVDIDLAKRLYFNNKEVDLFQSPGNVVVSNSMLFENLQHLIYSVFYCRGTIAVETSDEMYAKGVSDSKHFIEKLRSANKSIEDWDIGWLIGSVNPGGVYHIKKGNFSRYAYPGEFIKGMPSHGSAQTNESVKLLSRREHLDELDSFYHVFGNVAGEDHPQFQIRFYFNIFSDGAPALIETVTTSFNEYAIPFQFKCISAPEGYNRCDSSVLYLDKRYFKISMELLSAHYRKSRAHFKNNCPLFTKMIAPGWAFAESPLSQLESFGTSRSKLIAKSIVTAHQNGIEKNGWTTRIVETIHQNGYSLENFYTEPDSCFPYNFQEI